MAKMTQAIMTEPGNIIYQEVDIPEVKPDQIKVKMKRIGICGSDIHVNHGKHPYTKFIQSSRDTKSAQRWWRRARM